MNVNFIFQWIMSSGKPLISLTSQPYLWPQNCPVSGFALIPLIDIPADTIPQASMSITVSLRQWPVPPAAVSDVGPPRRSPGTAFQPPTPEGSVVSVPDVSRILRKMWNDEDNNPYGAFDQHESRLSDSLHSAALSPRKLTHPPPRIDP